MDRLKNILFFPLAILFTLLVWSQPLALNLSDVPRPDLEQDEWIVDVAGILTGEELDVYNDLLADLEWELSVEVMVVIVDTVNAPTPKDFATTLFNDWQIGKAGIDNGLLILFVMEERRMEMETGYGLEAVLTDGWLRRMQEERIVPRFQANRYGDGLGAGLRAIDERLRQYPDAIGHDSAFLDRPRDVQSLQGLPRVLAIFSGVLTLLGMVGGGVFWFRRRRRFCRNCHQMMVRLSGPQTRDRLTAAQRQERALGTAKFSVYQCQGCSLTRVFESRRSVAGVKTCPACDSRTLQSTSRVVLQPTYEAHGFREITDQCTQCSHKTHRQVVIPKKVDHSSDFGRSDGGRGSGGSGRSGGGSSRSSGGGSSSGRSRGGGRSGGGGAGSSW